MRWKSRNFGLAAEIANTIAHDLKFPLAPEMIGQRAAFARAFRAGLGIHEYEPGRQVGRGSQRAVALAGHAPAPIPNPTDQGSRLSHENRPQS